MCAPKAFTVLHSLTPQTKCITWLCFYLVVCLSLFYLIVCLLQFPPSLIAGVKHLPAKISPPSSVYLQYPLPPWVMQVFHMFPLCWLVQPPNTHSPGPPPCFAQRPLRLELVVQPATEHGLYPPPCFLQCEDPPCALVVHPSNLHVPRAPCL